MSDVILIMGGPASGKSTLSNDFIKQDYVYLNRDKAGGKVASLLPTLRKTLATGSNVVIDNLFPTIESRKPFIDVCKENNVNIRCIHMNTSIEDCQINALHRMWDRRKRLFLTAEELKGIKDPNLFPAVVLFKYRKEFQKPTTSEGFSDIQTVNFTRKPKIGYNAKALILDYDDTLRKTNGAQSYPCHPSEVEILPNRKDILTSYKEKGYLLLGVSNQSGVHKGTLTYDDAVACFEKTNELLGHDIEYVFCPHQSNPPCCYCRKPQSASGVLLIERHKLNPVECIFVGDQTSDKTFAQRLGFKYFHPDKFFGVNHDSVGCC